MTELSYTEAMEVVLTRLDQMSITPGGVAALLVRLDTIDKRGEETVDLLRLLNGRVQEHGQTLAGHAQWMTSHQSTHETLDKRVNHISGKMNVVAGINAALAFIAGVLGLSPK